MKKQPNARAEMPRNLIFPRAELVYLPVTPEVARAVENAVQMTLDAPLNAPNPRRSAAGRAILHARKRRCPLSRSRPSELVHDKMPLPRLEGAKKGQRTKICVT